MKKRLLSILGFLVVPCASFVDVHASTEYGSGKDLYYVGKTIDVARAKDTADYNAGISVFTNDYYKNQLNPVNKIGGSKGKSYFICEMSKQEFRGALKTELGIELGKDRKVLGMTNSAKGKFDLSVSISGKKSISDMYMDYHQDYYYASQLIEDYLMDYKKKEMINNLNGEFLNDIVYLRDGNITYEDFFIKYGTHLITECELGTKIDVYAKYSSYEDVFDVEVASEFRYDKTNALSKIQKSSTSFNASVMGQYGYTKEGTDVYIEAVPYGASSFGLSDSGDIQGEIDRWNEKAMENPYIIGYKDDDNMDGTPDGLLPIYELIPANIGINKDVMKNEMMEYIKKYEYSVVSINDDNFEFENGWSKTVVPKNSSEVYKITDSGRWKQKKDEINVLTDIGYSAKLFEDNYKYFTLDVEFEKCCKNSGEKRIYLYNGITNSTSVGLVAQYVFTGKCSDFTNVSFNMVNQSYLDDIASWNYPVKSDPIKINVSNLCDTMYILYSAAGKGTDTWQNKNRRYKFTFYTD